MTGKSTVITLNHGVEMPTRQVPKRLACWMPLSVGSAMPLNLEHPPSRLVLRAGTATAHADRSTVSA
ncbi:hypothetical protein ABZY09_39730 [Streptomyces sp. NPDC002928]|uniref:hypothetical protein n=1 Tax=Streptomyces sp. NPDC002928 TaxID=3154440 RepID=UPI0033B5092B